MEEVTFSQIAQKAKQILLSERTSFESHTCYLHEENFLHAVENGDSKMALYWFHLLDTTGKSGHLSNHPLKQAQYIFVSHITQLTRAAIRGGVSEDLAFAYSDSYIQVADSCQTPLMIHRLRKESVFTFCQLVREKKNSPPYSQSTRKAIQYIQTHLSEKLTLSVLANVAGLSVGRFSHLFKDETGYSPMNYVQKERIQTSELMLKHTSKTIAEISLSLGFYSESHFNYYFKKYQGVTPSYYRHYC